MTTSTVSAAGALKRTNYTHEAAADAIIANPAITQNELAAIFGYSVPWMSRVVNSDAFQNYLATRSAELVDPALRESVEAGLKALVNQSLNILLEKLNAPPAMVKDETVLKALEISSKALGYGARAPTVEVNNIQNIAVVPAKSASSAEWMQHFAPKAAPPAPPLTLEHKEVAE